MLARHVGPAPGRSSRRWAAPDHTAEDSIADHVYRLIELVGSSEESIEDAIETAIGRASTSVRQLRWFEVVQTRGQIDAGRVQHYQVTLRAGFTLEENDRAP